MKRTVKKIYLSVILSIIVMLRSSIFVDAATLQEVYEQYKEDEQFKMHYQYSPESAMDMLRSIVESQNSPSVFAVSPSDAKAYCDVPLKQQTKSYNCGFATMLQTLYGMGKQSTVSGNSDSAKMDQLEAEMMEMKIQSGQSGEKTAIVWMVASMLNSKTGSSYKYVVGNSITQYEFYSLVRQSLTGNHPVILHARTKPLTYYQGHDARHYLSLDQMQAGENNKCRIADCNDDNKYFGYHDVSIEEAYKCISEYGGRYLIYN